MSFRALLLASFVVILFAPVSAQVYGEYDDLGELFLKPFGVRNQGMGWAGTADGTVAANLFYNPANLVSHRGFEIAFETQNWQDDHDFKNGGAAARFKTGKSNTKKFHIATALWYGGQKDVYEGMGETIETTNWYLSGALALGFQTERFEIGFGAAVKPAFVKFESFDEDATAWAFDVGFKFGGVLVDKRGHMLTGFGGVSMLNFGEDAETESAMSELPTDVRAGVSFRYGSPPTSTRAQAMISAIAITMNAEIVDHSMQRDVDTSTGATNPPMGSMIGAELCFYNVFNFRYGYMDNGLNGWVDSETYGVGLQFANEQFEAALDISHLPELYADGPGVTSTGVSLAWFF